ncbi:MAG: CDP-alcohol phosphatidyltransferase family protein [Acidobacteriota bacterium]|nr:CDP-alcohol phosphatidyltransferase family protein [Acidobacteriota bacterium]
MRPLDTVLRQLTVANQLTLLRLAAVPALALALLGGAPGIALIVYVVAALTDSLDGIAARRLGQQTVLGSFLDPAADKLMMLVAYVTLAMPDHPRPFPDFELAWHVPAWLALLVVARDVLIVLVSAILSLAYNVRSFSPSRIGKWTTGFEMGTAGVYLLANVWPEVIPPALLTFGKLSTGSLVVLSGLLYLRLVTGMIRRLAQGTDG